MSVSGRVVVLDIESGALLGNRLSDPYQRQLAVYLPPGYDDPRLTGRRYPVCYFLSSHGSTLYTHVQWNQWEETLPQRLDRLIGSEAMPPVIVAIPDCWTRFGGSQYLDSALGNYGAYLLNEIIPLVDATFRTLAHRDQRGVIGHSSGGYGALVHAMQRPDVFGAVACRAPDSYWEFSVMPALSRLHQQMQKWGGFAEFIAAVPTIRPKNASFWEAIHTLMQCMVYGANLADPLGFDSPIDLDTGALIPEVWERWLQYDPVRMVGRPEVQAALRRMRLIFLEVGQFDEYQLQVGARLLHRQLAALNIEHRYEEFPDGHSNTSYRYDVSLPLLAKALSE